MMNTEYHSPQQISATCSPDELARAIVVTRELLDFGTTRLPHETTERLRAMRMQVLSASSVAAAQPDTAKIMVQPIVWWRNWNNWLKSGVAFGSVALAVLLTNGVSHHGAAVSDSTTASNAMLSASSDNISVAANPATRGLSAQTTSVASLAAQQPTANTNVGAVASAATLTTLVASASQSSASLNPASKDAVAQSMAQVTATGGNEDAEVNAVLQEQIPLQAYLNDDFNYYVDRQTVRTNGNERKNPNTPSPM